MRASARRVHSSPDSPRLRTWTLRPGASPDASSHTCTFRPASSSVPSLPSSESRPGNTSGFRHVKSDAVRRPAWCTHPVSTAAQEVRPRDIGEFVELPPPVAPKMLHATALVSPDAYSEGGNRSTSPPPRRRGRGDGDEWRGLVGHEDVPRDARDLVRRRERALEPVIGVCRRRRQELSSGDQIGGESPDVVGNVDVFGKSAGRTVCLRQRRRALEREV